MDNFTKSENTVLKTEDNISEGNNSADYPVYSEEELEVIRKRMEQRRAERRAAAHRRIMRNRAVAIAILLIIGILIFRACHDDNGITEPSQSSSSQTERSGSKAKKSDSEPAVKTDTPSEKNEHDIEQVNGMTFVDGILIVNKTYSLPADYDPGVSTVAQNAFDNMSAAAANDGITLFVNSGYRSYQEQETLYNSYAMERGTKAADEVSSRPGHSEHQTGLTFDVNTTENSFAGTPEANWLAEHCCEYGFIIRYPEDKEDITGYIYEPWHIRYIGKEKAKAVTESGLCLEEYLDITSDYKYADDNSAS